MPPGNNDAGPREDSGRLKHARNLARAGAPAPRSNVPVIAGTRVASGFEQHSGKPLDLPLVIMGSGYTLVLFWFLWNLWPTFQNRPKAINPVVLTLTILMFVVVIVFLVALIRFFAREILSQASAESWLTVRSWPLKPGANVRMQYRARTRAGGEIEAIDVVLRCFEMVQWKDLRGLRHSKVCVREVSVPTMRAYAMVNGSAGADWALRVPPDGPPSFEGESCSIQWILTVDLRIARAPDSSLAFTVLVSPEGGS